MDKVIELVISWIRKKLKNPKFYAVIAALVIVVFLIFPYIDANFFFYNRIEKRIDILQGLSEIDIDRISQSSALQEEYDAILSEIGEQREWSVSGAISTDENPSIMLLKFLTGGVLAWIVALFVPFMGTFKDKKTKILAFIIVALIGGFFGWIGSIIPTIINPWINYIGYPFLQLIALIALTIKPKNG